MRRAAWRPTSAFQPGAPLAAAAAITQAASVGGGCREALWQSSEPARGLVPELLVAVGEADDALGLGLLRFRPGLGGFLVSHARQHSLGGGPCWGVSLAERPAERARRIILSEVDEARLAGYDCGCGGDGVNTAAAALPITTSTTVATTMSPGCTER